MKTRYFEMNEGTSSKFWEIRGSANEIHTRYGKIGAAGQSTVKDEGSKAAAQKLYDKLIREKIKNGYVEREGAGPTARAPAAAKKSKDKAAPSAGTSAFVTAGRSFVFEVADFDARDRYRFTIERCDGELVVRFEGCGDGQWIFADAALASARSFVVLSQGSAHGSNGKALPKVVKRDLPPFLLSRRVFAELRKGPSKVRPEWSEDEIEIAITAKGKAALLVDGELRKVDAFKAEGRDLVMWVVDDEAWPFIVSREEGDNYWRLLGRGAVAIAGTKKDSEAVISNEQPFTTTKRAKLDDDAAIVAALRGKQSLKDRCRAAELAGKRRSPETREALFFALGAESNDLYYAAQRALRNRSGEPGFAEALATALAAAAREVLPSSPSERPFTDRDRRANRLIDAVESDHLEHASLAELVRTIARSHANAPLRNWACGVLVINLEDRVMQQELVDRIDAAEPFSDVEAAKHAAAAALALLPPNQARAKIKRLADKQPPEMRDEIGEGAFFLLDVADPEWVRELVSWLRTAGDEQRELVVRKLRDVRTWAEVYDVQDPEHVKILVEVYRRAADAKVSDNLDEALGQVTKPKALGALLTLFEEDRPYTHPGSRIMGSLLDAVPAKVLAPMLREVLPRAFFDHVGWGELVTTLSERKEPVWKSLLEVVAQRLESLNDPGSYGDMIQSLRSPG
jgi:predicted DNA-binding WGR domain protein